MQDKRAIGEANAGIIRKAYGDFARGDVPAVFAAFDPAITWHVPGQGPLSGTITGHGAIGQFFQRTMELSGGAFGIDVHNVLADGDVVLALVTVKAQRNGASAAFPKCTSGVSGMAGRPSSPSTRATSIGKTASGPDR